MPYKILHININENKTGLHYTCSDMYTNHIHIPCISIRVSSPAYDSAYITQPCRPQHRGMSTIAGMCNTTTGMAHGHSSDTLTTGGYVDMVAVHWARGAQSTARLEQHNLQQFIRHRRPRSVTVKHIALSPYLHVHTPHAAQ